MAQPDLDSLQTWRYELPPELIASTPAAVRDASRLLVVERATGTIHHRSIRDLPELLSAGDLLVFNNTQVLPARLFGCRTATGGRWEGLFIEECAPGHWLLLGETRGRLQPGETITVTPAYAQPGDAAPRLTLHLLEKREQGAWLVRTDDPRPALEILQQFGSLPLPPYMKRKLADEQDRQRYQTCFAAEPGAVAAPTAGLHFTPELLQHCAASGIRSTQLTLHVGIGTFRPVVTDRLSEHQMHDEWCRLPQSAVDHIATTRQGQGRVVAVGTTSVRTLEAAAAAVSPADHTASAENAGPAGSGSRPLPLAAWQGRTRLFIRPGHQFQVVDGLLTNFHLPGSTLLVLVAALAGYDLIMEAYRQAIQHRYRFYSYGDAMLIL